MKSMKTILSTLVLSLIFITANAQQSFSAEIAKVEDKNVNNYVVLTRKVEQLKPILLAAQQLAKEDNNQFGNFEIIVCGKEIGDLTNEEKMKEHLENAERVNATIIACGFSLNKFKVDPNKIPGNIKIIDNGILHNINLQKKGYYSLEL